jgi:hypothetical protein
MNIDGPLLRKLAWPVFWILWITVPVHFQWFAINRIDCHICFRDVLVHAFGCFGYVMLGGMIYSFSKPAGSTVDGQLQSGGRAGSGLAARENVRETTFALAVLFAVMTFASAYRPTWLL